MEMKKRMNFISSRSVKTIMAATITFSMLNVLDANAYDKPSKTLNADTLGTELVTVLDIATENKIENRINSDTIWNTSFDAAQVLETELYNTIKSWQYSGSFWDIDNQLRNKEERVNNIESLKKSKRHLRWHKTAKN